MGRGTVVRNTTPTPRAGPSTPKIDSSRFSLLRETLEEDNLWESGSDSSTYSDYNNNYDSDGSTVAPSMLPIFASGGGAKKRPKEKKGKGATPAPAVKSLGGPSKLPAADLGQKQQQMESKKVSTDKDEFLEMPPEVAMELVRTAFTKVLDGHFAKLYLKINNLKMEVLTLNTTVASLVEENKKLGRIGGFAPDPVLRGFLSPNNQYNIY